MVQTMITLKRLFLFCCLALLILVILSISWYHQLRTLNLGPLSQLNTNEARLLESGGMLNPFWLTDVREQLMEKNDFGQFSAANTTLFVNSHPNWQTLLTNPIAVRLPLKLLYKISDQDEHSSIIISGRDSVHTKEWWQGIIRLNVQYSSEKGLTKLAVYDGKSARPELTFTVHQVRKESLIIIIGKQSMTDLLVYSSGGHLLYQANLARKPQLQLPFGLLPDKSVRIGVLLAPKGKLEVQQLLLYAKPD